MNKIHNFEYYRGMIDRIYYILILFEKNDINFRSYVKTIYLEFGGNIEFGDKAVQIKNLLNNLLRDDVIKSDVKKIVFDSINILDILLSNWNTWRWNDG